MAIHRCLDCNATMKPDETTCWACGSEVKPREAVPGLGARFAMFINFFFIVSIVITIASMFTDLMPPFLRCATVTVVLYLVKSSATQMMEKDKKRG